MRPQILLQKPSRMPNVHKQECEKHWRCVEDVDEELMVIDVDVHFRALGGRELDDSEDDSVLSVS
jgi:hypothetical protein